MRGTIKKRTRVRLALLLTGCLCLCSACQGNNPTEPILPLVKVVLEDSRYFSASRQTAYLSSGEDYTFELQFNEGVSFGSCNYTDYSVRNREDNVTELTLHGVYYPLRLIVQTASLDSTVSYDLNGGSFLDGRSGSSFLSFVDLTHHLRANTDTGDEIGRDGFTQIGWNTKRDGSGEHVGLGSRITVQKREIRELYAEWAEWEPAENFDYIECSGGIALTGYRGEPTGDCLVIPAKIDGKTVNTVSEGAIHTDRKVLVLPRSLLNVEKGAFVRSAFREIYFYDTLISVFDDSFGAPIPTVHLNAGLAPRYQSSNTNTQFAENMDRLILNQNHQKMVFFAGCSMCFGLKSELIDAKYGNDYVVMDMGVIGSTLATVQLECIANYLGAGDIFVHAPEERSGYQMMYNLEGESRMFVMAEGNYDLLALGDMSIVENFWTSYCNFNSARGHLPAGKYADYLTCYNAYGDYCVERPMRDEDVKWHTNDTYEVQYITDESVNRLCALYDKMKVRGAEVYFSFAPHNRQSFGGTCLNERMWTVFENRYREVLEPRGYTVISHAEDYIFDGRYFYDTDYHLNDVGAELRTQRLLKDLEQVIG